MRVLAVRQPWAHAIIHLGKDVENRTRNVAGEYRGLVAIHAGRAPFEKHNMASRALKAAHGTSVPHQVVFGAIIGVVNLVDSHLDTDHEHDAGMPSVCRCTSRWAETGAHHLVLENPRPLVEPIPFKGGLGLRTLDEAIERQVLAGVRS